MPPVHPLVRILILNAILSVLALALYGWDKRAATRKRRRVPESTLHILALLGGWPGALLAQRAFRHKTQKRSFRRRFALTILVNLLVCAGIVLRLAG